VLAGGAAELDGDAAELDGGADVEVPVSWTCTSFVSRSSMNTMLEKGAARSI